MKAPIRITYKTVWKKDQVATISVFSFSEYQDPGTYVDLWKSTVIPQWVLDDLIYRIREHALLFAHIERTRLK